MMLFLTLPPKHHRDRFRTTINVMCDAIGTILVNLLSEKDMAEADRVRDSRSLAIMISNY